MAVVWAMYKKGAGNDKQGKDVGNLCPYRNFSQAINLIYMVLVSKLLQNDIICADVVYPPGEKLSYLLIFAQMKDLLGVYNVEHPSQT